MTNNKDKIKQIIQCSNGVTASEISKKLNYICTDTVYRNANKLVQEGLVEKIKDGNRYIYLPKK
ncbi:hypothetical protein BV378_20150 [Nostoc sp. RF31YmG]|jgi:Fe2+ or Zn2+ uptake regulation protein|nr:hypothetical protein BV378_20150 [Nostoc sp. RF31YmG]